MDQPRQAPLISVSTILAETGAYGLIWLDKDLEVAAKYGALVSDIEIGAPVIDQIPALFGYEDDIKPLSDQPGKLFVLPAVSMPNRQLGGPPEDTPRLNITAFWSRQDSQFILLIARASSGSNSDIEISQQMRKRLMAEEALAQKTKQLELANRDLEEYAEIISHDLSAPLRAIRYLTHDIESDLEQSNHESAKTHLTDLRSHSKRMSSMMTDLLDYASLGLKTEVRELIDTKALIDEITGALPRPKDMVIKIEGEWPTIETMKAPLDLVIRNLIDNAIKHHDKISGRICVKAAHLADGAHFNFSIYDDGPGIAPQHHSAVLLPFRTLNTHKTNSTQGQPNSPPDQSASSRGMGLALVNRTLATVGGTLTLNSNPASKRGTEFLISWPLQTATTQ